MHRSVSSPPTGLFWTLLRSWRNPPTPSSASRRNDMLAPTRLRTVERRRGIPEWVHPTTQSNSAGNQPGRPASQCGRTAPPTASTRGSEKQLAIRSSQWGVAVASSSRKATTSPELAAIPLLRVPESPCRSRLVTTRTSVQRCRLSSSSSGAWSTARMISWAGKVWERTDEIASPRAPSRSMV
jgi:hypothetical protein